MIAVILLVPATKPLVDSRFLQEKKPGAGGSADAVEVSLERSPVPPSAASPCTHINKGNSSGGHCPWSKVYKAFYEIPFNPIRVEILKLNLGVRMKLPLHERSVEIRAIQADKASRGKPAQQPLVVALSFGHHPPLAFAKIDNASKSILYTAPTFQLRDNGKSSWPELVGINGEVAAKIIAGENPKVRVSIVEEGMMVTMEISCDRVRVWVDENGIVKDIPEIG
ncbi:hypothetical protein SADUNF_Sadunf05G0164600 [Salix dunnii]|uniref:Uncharacterized protein n=1 Tax=Salix dunnii TaxID=1413687 RepID=A0A835KBN3_9ROSI|nr:hypothetical protein SADUNF_Sadunf05G0164600 [Salix dunnii]